MLMRRAVALFFVIWLAAGMGGSAGAADRPFDGPANWGGTGLMEIPTARVMREGRFRVGASQIDPYRYYSFAIAPLEGLEVGGRVTENLDIIASSAASWSGYGNYKDKAVDLKYRLLPEGKWWPALAVGIMDPHGTRVYAAQYLVASKQIYPFDFTIGFGNGRFGTRRLPSQGEGIRIEMLSDNASWRRDGQFFGGVQFAWSERLLLMAEYSPIRFHESGDPSQRSGGSFKEPVPSKINIGLRWRPYDWLEAGLSWQRGNQAGVNLSTAFDLGVPMIPLFDAPYREKPEHRPGPAEERIARGLAASGFSDIIVRQDGETLAVDARNDKYFYTPRALSVMLRLVTALAPADVRAIRLILSENGIPVVEMTTPREDADLLLAEKLTPAQFLALKYGDSYRISSLDSDRTAPAIEGETGKYGDSYRISSRGGDGAGNPAPGGEAGSGPGAPGVSEHDAAGKLGSCPQLFCTGITEGLQGRRFNREWWNYGIRPSVSLFLNDPSGFIKYRAGAQGWVSLYPWRGGSLVTGLDLFPLNTVSTSNAPLSTAVRSDLVPYQQNKVVLGKLMFDQLAKFPGEVHGRLTAGLLEMQYAGIDAELARPFFDGRLMLGLSGSVVRKRDPDRVLGFKEGEAKSRYETAFLNTRLNVPELEGAIDLKLGQFLAGDRGMRLTLSKFFNGVVLSAWYSATNTDFFTDPHNRGYHDKGISVTVPLRLFVGTDSRTAYSFGISPWTRDVAQDIEHFTPLFDHIGRNTPLYLKKDSLSRDSRRAGFENR